MKNYNFVTWWLDLSVKPLVYKIWKMGITTIMFVLWVVFVAVYPDMYWNFSLVAVLPVAVIDFTWDGINYYLFRKGKLTIKDKRQDVDKSDAQPSEKQADQ